MGSGVLEGVGINLLAAGLERGYDASREKLTTVNQNSEFSTHLDALETEFQRELHQQISDEVDGPESNSLIEVVETWDPLVHELYNLEEAAPTSDAVTDETHDRVLFETKAEAVESIVDAWATAADVTVDATLEETLSKVVAEAYVAAFDGFVERIKGTDLADVFELETLYQIQRQLDEFARQYTEPKVYKTRAEFEQRLFSQQEYVPVAAKRESNDYLGSGETDAVDDARDELVRLLDAGRDIVTVYGEGGSGKSQLLAAAGAVLEDRNDRDIYYITNPEQTKPPELTRDTVVFVDDAGHKQMAYFLRRAARSERATANKEYSVQVVAAARSVYEQTVEEVVNELPQLDASTLRLQSLSDEQAQELLASFDLDGEAVEQIVEMADGNPFFAVMFGRLAAEEGEVESEMRHAFEKVVGRMVEADIGAVSESSDDLRRFFRALAVWQTYNEPDDADSLAAVAPSFENRVQRQEQFRELTAKQYLDWRGDRRTDATYSFRYDVVADYLLFEALDADRYQIYAPEVVASKPQALAQGLAGLQSSPLRPFYPNAEDHIRTQTEWLLKQVFDEELPVPAIFGTVAQIALAFPDQIPTDRLDELFENYDQIDELLEPVMVLTAVASRQAETNDDWLSEFGYWIDRFREIHSHTGEGTDQLAAVLYNAVTGNGWAQRLEEMADRLAQLDTLHENHPKQAVRHHLATALTNAAANYGKGERWEAMSDRLTQLDALHEEYPEQSIRHKLAKALTNAVGYYGKGERREAMSDRLTQLDALHTEYPEQAVRHELAKALFNAVTSYGEGGKYGEMSNCVAQLDALYEKYPEQAVRHELAEALKNAAADYGEGERWEAMANCLAQLETLHDDYLDQAVRHELAEALTNAAADYGKGERWEAMSDRLTQLDALHTEYPEQAVRHQLAKALFNATRDYGGRERWEEMSDCLTQLDALHTEYPEQAVRHQLAKALLSAVGISLEREIHTQREFVDRLKSLATTYDDFGGLTSEDEFFQVEQNQVLALLELDEESAVKLLTVFETVMSESVWTRFSSAVLSKIDQRFADGDLSKETYHRFATILT